jgi:hypothetical protein
MNKKRLIRYTHFSRDQEPFDNDECAWQWFGTLTFSDAPKRDVIGVRWPGNRAISRYNQWFNELQAKEGKGCLNWVRVTECRLSETCFHVLFGGDRIGDKRKWLIHWSTVGGTASLYDYGPGKFCRYVLRNGKAHSTFEIDMDIHRCLWIFADHLGS